MSVQSPSLSLQRSEAEARAGLLSVQSSDSSLDWAVSVALAAGAGDDEVIAVIATLAPIIGSSRTSSGLAAVSCALDRDLKSAT